MLAAEQVKENNLEPFLKNKSPFNEKWAPQNLQNHFQILNSVPLLVVGAGGLGCELMKNLALLGVRLIHLVDMDTIDLTNLNRQFLFRLKDVGKYKADVVADFIMRRCPGTKVITHKEKVQTMPIDWYEQFPVIIGGLDNIEARLYLNSVAFKLCEKADGACVYIDGATQAFDGQVLVVKPFETSCYECSVEGMTKLKPATNSCTIANTPRTPQHCIQYIIQVVWGEKRENELLDSDNLEHMQWVYERSLERAKQYGIEGVTEMNTLGTVKNIIPAIASTNAFIAAKTANEVFNVLTECQPILNNYSLYIGGTSIGLRTMSREKSDTCRSCNSRINKLSVLKLKMKQTQFLRDLFPLVQQTYPTIVKPFVHYGGKQFLNPADTARWDSKVNLTWRELQKNGLINLEPVVLLYISHSSLKAELTVRVEIEQ